MGDLRDSIGQVAGYQMAYSYIQTKNKVAAMDAFRQASVLPYDKTIAEDAYFNWAKLAFDLNDDTSVFQDYLKKYEGRERGDRINSYIAVAALHERDYEGAIEAYARQLHEGKLSEGSSADFERFIQNGYSMSKGSGVLFG